MRNKECLVAKERIKKLTCGALIMKELYNFKGPSHINDYYTLVDFAHRHMKKVDWPHWSCIHHGFGKMVLNGSY